MKIVDRETFLKMPKGILYSEYQPCVFEGLYIKEESWECDFFCQDLIGNTDGYYDDIDFDLPFDLCFDSTGRDGKFDDDQLYAVYEEKDIIGFIERLKKLLPG